MQKARTLLLALLLAVAAAATATAAYDSAGIGPNHGSFFRERTTNFHDGSPSRMAGLSGREDQGGYVAWIAGRSEGGHWTRKRGYQTSYDGDYHRFCSGSDIIAGFQGWYTAGGVLKLQPNCRARGGSSLYTIQGLGNAPGGSTYKSIKCNNRDVAWGFWGKKNYYLMRVGLYCGAP